MSMYNFGIKASNDPFKNREIISFIESLGYENKIRLDGNVGKDPDPDTVYAAGCDEDNKVHCTLSRYCYAVYDSLEKAKEYLYVPNKEIKITVPEGYEIDEENSTFECIKFKKQLTYNNIVKELFKKNCFFVTYDGTVGYLNDIGVAQNHPNNCTSKRQAEKLLAINKLMNVAKYLNDGWEPDWENVTSNKYLIDIYHNKLGVWAVNARNCASVHFKTEKLAEQAIEILGEETIKLALCTDY